MRLKKARQILKGLADDTRLRIVNLLSRQELNVSQLHGILGCTQPTLSKHLARLRLTGIVSDRRQGLNVYYYLHKPEHKGHRQLVMAIMKGFSEVETFKRDIECANELKKTDKKGRSK